MILSGEAHLASWSQQQCTKLILGSRKGETDQGEGSKLLQAQGWGLDKCSGIRGLAT